MRILIEDLTGHRYFDGTGWNEAVEEARDFESVAQAETFCRANGLPRAMILVKFNDPKQDIRYQIGQGKAPLVSNPPTTRIKSLV